MTLGADQTAILKIIIFFVVLIVIFTVVTCILKLFVVSSLTYLLESRGSFSANGLSTQPSARIVSPHIQSLVNKPSLSTSYTAIAIESKITL
jgi:hypothetical protein